MNWADMNKAIRKWIFWLLHLTGFVLLYFVVRDLEWDRFLEVLKTFPLWKYLTGLVFLCVVYALKSLRWHLLNRSFGISTSWSMALLFYLSAGFLSVITPGRLGEFSKIYFLKRQCGTDLTSGTSSVILDRIWDVLVLSFAAGVSVFLLWSAPDLNRWAVLAAVLLFTASLLVVLFPAVIFIPVLFMSRRFSSLHMRLDEVFRLWKKNRFTNFIPSLVISAAAFLLLAFIPVLFSSQTPFPVEYVAGISSISISNILSFIPVTVAGFGTRELVFAAVWDLQAYPKEVALSVSTAYFMVTYLGSLVIGGVVYLLNLKKLYRPREIRSFSTDKAFPS